MSAINIIQRVARKLLTQNQPKGVITIPNRMTAEAKAGEIAATLQRAGLSMDRFDDFITSETDLIRLLNQIEAFEKKNLADNIRSGIRNTESAKVFDLKGKRIKDTDNIMGGEEMPPPGSRGGDDDIAAPFQSQEETLRNMTEAEIKANLEAQNKSAVENILKRKNREDVYGLEDYDTTNMSEIKKEIIRTETKLGNLNPDDPNFRAKAKPLVDKIEALKNKMREDKATGGRVGFFMGSRFPKGLATLREMLKFFSKGKERPGSEALRLVNPKQFNKFLEDPNIYKKFDIKRGIAAPDLIKNMQDDLAKSRTMMVEEILSAAKNIRKSDIGTMERKKEMIEEMMRRGIDRETAEEMANTLSTMAEAAAGKKLDTPKLTDEGILELENILKNMETGGKKKRDLNADGGRIGFKDGMTRRTFLKLLGGLASIPIIGKIVKPLKTVKGVKNVPIIKTDNVPGKPEWFDQLVNKVIIEGDDVTKRFATGERQSIHQKTLDDGSVVRVTEDIDQGAVRVEYDSYDNVFEDTVQLEYKKPLPDQGDPRPTAEFTTAESGPVGRQVGPDDYDMDIEEVGGTSIKDLDSDVSKLKEYATGKKPTMKELVQNIERRKKARRITEDPEAQSDAVIRRQGEMLDYDPEPDFASGGIARMLGE